MAQRILVVDDDRQIVRLLRAYLEKSGYHVLAAYDGDEALRVLRAERPDLILLDLMLPGRDGWEFTRIVRNDPTLSPAPIIMITARVEDQDKIVGLELGADDYVCKPFNPGEVVARVRAVLRRTTLETAAPEVIVAHGLRIDVGRHQVHLCGEPLDLTPTEFELLKTLAQRPGMVFTRQELITAALGYDYDGLERTVDSHIKNLRRKVAPADPSPESSMIETVFGVGYRFRVEPTSTGGASA